MKLWSLYDKQKQALQMAEEHKFTLLVGQGRASKTTLAVYYLFKRAIKYPNTSHVIFRNTLASAKDGIWAQTIKEVITHFFPVLPAMRDFQLNASSHVIHFPNGSRILLRGLDTPERATKVLSQQFATVLFDEAQTIDYSYFSLLLTRLPQPKGVDYTVKIICSANYAPKKHWTKLFFDEKINPENKVSHNQGVALMHFETRDNESIDAEGYLDTLDMAGDRKSRLMCAGNDWYEEIEGALWKDEDILRGERLPMDEYDEVVIAFDPAVTNNASSDAHGICIAGKKDEKYFVIESYEKNEDVNEIAKEVAAKYQLYSCSKLIYETNQGANWVESLINNHDPSVYCQGVRAKKGKLLRAEPIAALYKCGKVFHVGRFDLLESQMTSFQGKGDSPNSLDALVYAIKHLHENANFVDPNMI